MRKLLSLALIVFLATLAYRKLTYVPPPAPPEPPSALLTREPVAAPPTQASPRPVPGPFHCDGRQHCSQMRSCEEATYFLRHCPGTKMDGDRDGIPCEDQWCGHDEETARTQARSQR